MSMRDWKVLCLVAENSVEIEHTICDVFRCDNMKFFKSVLAYELNNKKMLRIGPTLMRRHNGFKNQG